MTAEIGVCPTLLSLSPIASRRGRRPRIHRARSAFDSSFVGPKSNGITKNDGISGEIYHLSNLRIGQEVEQACLLVAALELLYSFRKSEKLFLVKGQRSSEGEGIHSIFLPIVRWHQNQPLVGCPPSCQRVPDYFLLPLWPPSNIMCPSHLLLFCLPILGNWLVSQR